MNDYIKRNTWFAATVFGCLILVSPVQAASFDCEKAQTKLEKLICADAELSKLDEELNTAYKNALQDEKQAGSIRQAQKQWIKRRNGCSDSVCVKHAYEERLLSFSAEISISKTSSVEANNSVHVKDADTDGVNKSQAHYDLMMSEDNSVCKPILAQYNRNISLDLPKLRPPHPYPWPAPPALAVNWKVKPWNKSIPENERSLLERMYSYIEADVNGDGETETVVRWATWLRRDDRFSSLEIFPHGTELSDEEKKYRFQADHTINAMGGDGYDFPKLKGRATPETLNDFDLIQYNGKYYVTGKTVEMDGVIEIRDDPQWRVISRVRSGEPETSPESILDWVLDSVCYFKLKITK